MVSVFGKRTTCLIANPIEDIISWIKSQATASTFGVRVTTTKGIFLRT